MNRNKENISRCDYVYQATNYSYKLEISKKLTLKIEHITFLMTWSILNTLIQAYEKQTKRRTKILVFTTLDILD